MLKFILNLKLHVLTCNEFSDVIMSYGYGTGFFTVHDFYFFGAENYKYTLENYTFLYIWIGKFITKRQNEFVIKQNNFTYIKHI
jgi:hypothetical protein